jgi:hypothetical protein
MLRYRPGSAPPGASSLGAKDDRVTRLWKTLAGLALAWPLLAPAQSKLILPQNQDDIRRLTEAAPSGPCVKCGVVTDLRSETRERSTNRAPETLPPSDIGGNLTTTPIIGKKAVKAARNANSPVTFYKLTVRYDDGTYAFFEQDDEPDFAKGDRVDVIDGRVVRRTDQ